MATVNLNNSPSAGPLTAAELERYRGMQNVAKTFTSCHGPCQQGRLLCPCPEACESAAEADLGPATGILVALAIVVGVVGIISLAAVLI